MKKRKLLGVGKTKTWRCTKCGLVANKRFCDRCKTDDHAQPTQWAWDERKQEQKEAKDRTLE